MLLAIPFPNISPEIFSFEIGNFTLALRWYALGYIVGLLVGWRIMVRLFSNDALWGGKAPMEPRKAEDLLTWLVVGIILGGRLGFVLFYQPEFYLSNPSQILKVWQGGMSFHGGFLGVIIAGGLFCWHHKLSFWRIGDAVAAGTPVGIFLVRCANFINGELWGRPTTVPWAVEFPAQAAACPDTWLLPCTRHPSQLYEAGLEGILLGLIILALIKRGKTLHVPGRIVGVFFLVYGLARFFVENFRQADEQFTSLDNPLGYVVHIGEIGLTQGQILSLPMVVIGVIILIWKRSKA